MCIAESLVDIKGRRSSFPMRVTAILAILLTSLFARGFSASLIRFSQTTAQLFGGDSLTLTFEANVGEFVRKTGATCVVLVFLMVPSTAGGTFNNWRSSG